MRRATTYEETDYEVYDHTEVEQDAHLPVPRAPTRARLSSAVKGIHDSGVQRTCSRKLRVRSR